MAAQTVRILGLRELDRAFGQVSRETRLGMRAELRAIAEPVRSEAQELAPQKISNIGDQWARMRVGVTARGAYVAPQSRGRGKIRRPNLAGLLMDQAMLPALRDHEAEIVAGLGLWLDAVGRGAGF